MRGVNSSKLELQQMQKASIERERERFFYLFFFARKVGFQTRGNRTNLTRIASRQNDKDRTKEPK